MKDLVIDELNKEILKKSKKRIRDDWIRLWQSLINMLSSLNENNKEAIVQKIFYMEDDEFCQLTWLSYEAISIWHGNNLTIQQKRKRLK